MVGSKERWKTAEDLTTVFQDSEPEQRERRGN
jgi:hypothetical protein